MVVLAASILAPAALLAGPSLIAPAEITVGRNLQGYSGIKLGVPAPENGLEVTVTSDDPTRLLLAMGPDQPGSKSITLKVNGNYVETPDFCVQALADTGAATFTATAPGFGSTKGKVKLARSVIVMTGPLKGPTFDTTPGEQSKIIFYSAHVDQAGDVVQQPIAGGLSVNVDLTSSNAKVGAITVPSVTLKSGESSVNAVFKPAGVGTTTLAMKIPPGFSPPPKLASVTANIGLPGIGLTGEINLGKDLQVMGVVLLGEAAPVGGLDVTLTSDDPQKMVISAKEDQLGSKSVTLHVPAGEMKAQYYLQALSESGTVNHTATAPGYRSRTAPVYLAPSGILVVFQPYGPPDRAEVQRNTRDARPFTASLARKRKLQLALWVVYLDRDTHRGADITVQSLRAGVTPTVELTSSNPAVGTVTSPATLNPLSRTLEVDFTALTPGKTVISVSTPSGFTTPSNAVTVGATITE